MKTKVFFLVLLVTALSLSGVAQTEQQSVNIQSTNNQTGQSAQSPRPSQSGQTVSTTGQARSPGLKTKILDVKYRDPIKLQITLSLLLSNAQGVALIPDQQYGLLTVRDFPENIAAIEEALKRLDVPAAPGSSMRLTNYEVQLYLLATSKTQTDKNSLPVALEPVVMQLQETLKYKGYRLITTILNRAEEGAKVEGNGVTDALFPLPADSGKSFYNYSVSGFGIVKDDSGKEMVRLNRFIFNVKTPLLFVNDGKTTTQYQDAGVSTSLSLRDGEKVVVGTANLGVSDEAIIVVVSVKKIK